MNRITTIAICALAWLGSAVAARAEWQDDFSVLLQTYVKADGVDYRAWSANRTDLRRLAEVTSAISMEAPSGTRNQRLAWYLNAYNALALRKVLDAPLGGGESEAWQQSLFAARDLVVAGERVSLDQLEHGIIGPTFKDPRVHFALHRASISSGPLLNRAFVAASLNADLLAQTRSFLSRHPNGVRVSADGKNAEVSVLFSWFRDEFDRGDLRAYINRYRSEPLDPDTNITFLTYDWHRNQSRAALADK